MTAFQQPANLATNKAVVTVVIIGLARPNSGSKFLYSDQQKKICQHISPYLIDSTVTQIDKLSRPFSSLPDMKLGNMPYGAGLLMTSDEVEQLLHEEPHARKFVRRFAGGEEFLYSKARFCLWIEDEELNEAMRIPFVKERVISVRAQREKSSDISGRKLATRSHQFRERFTARNHSIVLARTSSELRPFLPVGIADSSWIFSTETLVLYDSPLWTLALLSSSMHVVWIATVCGKLETRYRYSNTLGWNSFPIPTLTEKNKADLIRCAGDILLAREAHFPATIADLYEPEAMPANLRAAHDRNDEVLERIYIGRRFKNDTERLEKLFDMYTKMTAGSCPEKKRKVGTA